MLLAKKIYLITSQFPKEEKYGLISQINRCAVSVPSNIAEGSSRTSKKDFAHFVKISLGSLFELETQLILANEFKMLNDDNLKESIESIIPLQKMITNFLKSLNND